MFPRTGVGGNPAGGDGAVSKSPEKFSVPMVTLLLGLLDIGQGSGDPVQGVVDGLVDWFTVFGFEPVFFVPDINGRGLELDFQ